MMPIPRRSPHSISHPGLRRVSRIKGRTHVSTRPRATPLLKISLAPQRASTHVANSDVGRRMVLSVLAPAPLADKGSVGYRAASHRGADEDAVLGMRIGSCDGAPRAHRPG